MKLSTRTRYGLRALVDLALNSTDGTPVPVREIARRQGLSESYLEKLFGTLRKARLVRSIRGVAGGYLLGRSPDQISLTQVLETLEGPIVISDCVEGTGCENSGSCPAGLLWSRLKDNIDSLMSSTTLQDLLEDHRKLKETGGPER